jgi:DNA-binding NarL/FixJ family response regulator
MSAPRPLSVLLVDDSVVISTRLRDCLAEDPLIRIVGVAGSGAEALLQFHLFTPDVVVLDIGLPDTSGLALLRAFKDQRPSCVVIMLTASEECREKAMALGAEHFCDKAREFGHAADIVMRIAAQRAAEAQPRPSSSPVTPDQPQPAA